jgi:hypothetical protein
MVNHAVVFEWARAAGRKRRKSSPAMTGAFGKRAWDFRAVGVFFRSDFLT